MKSILLLFIIFLHCAIYAQTNNETYAVDSNSVVHPGVPKGEILKFTFSNSRIFPGTWREYWVYVPAQYRADKPACVYVNQDGIQWNAPIVFDNLIHQKAIPVTIGIFITPGRVLADNGVQANDRYNRSIEYDGLGDAYTKFLLTEIFPDVETKITSDGRAIRLSKNGNDRAIGGSSSGAVCAFTAAWEHPEEFSRVFSAIGTYTGLRGADRYPVMIRKYEPKPIRIFMQDGSNDLSLSLGDWWKANEYMERSLVFSGYEVMHVWGEGGHNGKHGTALFPEAIRWLWKDWPKPVVEGISKNQAFVDLLIPGAEWELVGQGYQFTEGIAANASGDVYFQDVSASKTYKIGTDGKPVLLSRDSKKASGTCFSFDGAMYTAAGGTKQVLKYGVNANENIVADSISGNDLVVAHNGNVYVTAPEGTQGKGKLILVRPNGKKEILEDALKFPNGCTLSPDQSQLYVTESASHWVWVYKIKPDGTLTHKQRFGWLHVPDNEENAWSDGLKCDTTGRIFVATRIGIQIMDPLGRVVAIMPAPPSNNQTSNLCFGGPDFNIMYVTAGDKVFRRKLKTRAANSFDKPFKTFTPRL